jgi:transcriptional regulator with PAS, ATPase and Fis domain
MFIERLTPEGQERPELSPDAIAALEGYPWPGNVRELRNVAERAMAYAPVPSMLRAEHLRIIRG